MESQSASSPTVIIVCAGPAGLSAAACLTSRHIPVIILERDDTIAPLWRRRTYDRLHLHLPKHLCELPLRPYPPSAPTFLPRADFLRYLDEYAAAFGLQKLLRLRRRVDSAKFDAVTARWRITAANLESGAVEEYEARFMVVASGENDEPVLPADVQKAKEKLLFCLASLLQQIQIARCTLFNAVQLGLSFVCFNQLMYNLKRCLLLHLGDWHRTHIIKLVLLMKVVLFLY